MEWLGRRTGLRLRPSNSVAFCRSRLGRSGDRVSQDERQAVMNGRKRRPTGKTNALPIPDDIAFHAMQQETRIYDPEAFSAAIGERNGGVASEPKTSEEEIRATCIRRILEDPRGALRPSLMGSDDMLARLEQATASFGHFAEVTGVIRRAIALSTMTARPLSFPPVLVLSPAGLGKTFYCRTIANVLGTTCIPIAINATSDRGQLGGLSTLWRGAKMGKIAHGLLQTSETAGPIYLLDELDKSPSLVPGENTLDILLSALEPANSQNFVDEYLDVAVDLRSALWIASANDPRSLPAPLLDRMLVVEVPWPDQDQARAIAVSIAETVCARTGIIGVKTCAVDAVLALSPRSMRRCLEMAAGYAASARRHAVAREDVEGALRLMRRDERAPIGFLR